MPELPEMEVYRTKLAEQISGARIIGTEVARDKSINVSADLWEQQLVGRTVWYVERKGKHLLIHLDNGKRLLLHLMLGGSMYFGPEEERPERTVQVTIKFSTGNLYFTGLRLGYVHLHSVKEVEEQLRELGSDPFDKRLTIDKFIQRFDRKRGAIKKALIEQHILSGIGNYYADEIAFAASIRPDAKIPSLDRASWERLYHAMHSVLREATARGGYMDTPFSSIDQLTGGYNSLRQVYDRAGEICSRCGSTIEQIEISSRKAFVCSGCQHEA